MIKLKIKKGDIVKVISGESKGDQGRVLEVFKADNKAIVEGVNLVTKHTKPNAKHTKGGRIEEEAPIHISNLMFVDPTTDIPTRVGRKLDEKSKKIVRYSKKSGEEIK